MHSFEDLKALLSTYISNPDDQKLIQSAYDFAAEKHKNQFRKSGEPYIHHPLEVAYICAKLQAGPATIASAFLHDVVEDTDTPIQEIETRFGADVRLIVDSLTKIQRMKLSHMSKEDFEAEDHRKIFLGMANDVRVIIVKLADRLHNMRTLQSLSPDRQHALAKETLEVFTPIAHRLGIYTVQSELEDLSLKYLEPEIYAKIKAMVDERFENRKDALEQFKKRIADQLYEHGIPFRMESRVKSIYSIYKKMYKKGHSFDEIFDILAIRVITKTTVNCYEILGMIHTTYAPIPGRFKDYIAMPKPNMYQSLHTSVMAGDGSVYEIQIRTEEMDQIAETGVAAHWKYKEGSHYNPKEEQKEIENQLHWFRDFVSLSGQEKGTAKEYMETLTHDIFGANVYVFTPLGRVIELPTGSTTLDFAYRIHTKVGDAAVGALVNGALVPLSTELKTGDICEIKTSPNASGPNTSWLDIAKTSSAKAHIRRALQKKDASIMKEEKIKQGRTSMMDSFKMQGFEEEEAMKILNDSFPKLENEFHCESIDDLFVMLCSRNPAPGAVLEFLHVKKKLAPKLSKKKTQKEISSNCPVEVPGGITGLAVTISQCCTPIPGDEIVGYITRGKGITVHRKDCPNIAKEKARLIPLQWREDLDPTASYPVDIEVIANDRQGLAADILQTISAKSILVSDLKIHLVTETMNDVINLTINVKSAKALEDLFVALMGVKSVFAVNRLTH